MSFLTDGYWPWWLGALAFAAIVMGIYFIERRLLGVSGSFRRAVTPESEAERAMHRADSSAIEDAMLKATLEEFGPEAVEAFMKEMAAEEAETEKPVLNRDPLPRGAHVVFLVMLAVGGLLSALLSGGWELRSTLGSVHTELMHGELASYLAIAVGSILVGFGARMSGGCTSGHGLCGCSRLEPASLVATSCFFGVAIVVTHLLGALL